MKHSFLYDTDAAVIAGVLFILMLLAIKIGAQSTSSKTGQRPDHSGILSALLGLFALLLAFTFGMAGSRYENRKNNIVNESNAIGTAILRADLYPDSLSNGFKNDLQKYLSARTAYFESGRDDQKVKTALTQSAAVSDLIWKHTSAVAREKDLIVPSNQMIPALNEMFDSASTTQAAYNSSVPESIVYMLLAFAVVVSFFIGYSATAKKTAEPVFVFGFCLLSCLVVFITLDLDRPRRGLIDLQQEVSLLNELRRHP